MSNNIKDAVSSVKKDGRFAENAVSFKRKSEFAGDAITSRRRYCESRRGDTASSKTTILH